MDTPSAPSIALARRLLAIEASSKGGVDAQVRAAVQVCEKLRIALTRFAGPEGFASLLRRALVLARAEVPSLAAVTLKPDGSLEGFETLADDGSDAAVAVIANLLGLLVTFVGEPLTLRLVRESWPDASFE